MAISPKRRSRRLIEKKDNQISAPTPSSQKDSAQRSIQRTVRDSSIATNNKVTSSNQEPNFNIKKRRGQPLHQDKENLGNTREELKKQNTRILGNVNCPQEMYDFECPVCHLMFKTESALKAHVPLHDLIKSFQCKECYERFRSYPELKLHVICHFPGERLQSNRPNRCPSLMPPPPPTSPQDTHDSGSSSSQDDEPSEPKSPKIILSGPNADICETEVFEFECPECTKKFKSQEDLDSHQRDLKEKKPFVCNECHRHFRTESHFQRHQAGHEVPFECKECLRKFTTQEELKWHKSRVEEWKPFVCHGCHKRFKKRSQLNRHKCRYSHSSKPHTSTSTNNPSVSLVTTLLTPQQSQQDFHQNSIQRIDTTGRSVLGSCENLKQLNGDSHTEEIHFTFQSNKCDNKFDSNNDKESYQFYQNEYKTSESDVNSKELKGIPQLKCHQQVFKENRHLLWGHFNKFPASDLIGHQPMHKDEKPGGDKPIQGSMSPQKFKSVRNQHKHKFLHTEVGQFRCDFDNCDKKYKKSHKDVHKEVLKLFQCPSCPKKFKTQVAFRRHQRVHSDERTFSCGYDDCDKIFKTKFGLKSHRNLHALIYCY